MVARIARGFNQLIDDDAGRGAVGVPHGEIDHVDLRCPCLGPHLVGDREHVRRQLLNAIEILGVIGH